MTLAYHIGVMIDDDLNQSDLRLHPTGRPLHVRLLGPCGVFVSSQPEAQKVLGPGKPLLLLARLLVEPKGVQREQLATFLWDDMPDQRARASLRQALHLLRQALGPDALEGDRQQVRLSDPPASDLQSFQAAVRDGALEEAVRWYGGPFLADLSITDANEAELWVADQRRRLVRQFVRAASELVTRRLRNGDAADELTRQLLETDPSVVSTWELRLESLTVTDHRSGVRDTLAALQQALQQDGTIDPSQAGEARRLLARYTAADRPSVEASDVTPQLLGPRTRLVGRRTELVQLRALWDGVRRDRQGARLLVSGHAGIGKSRLLFEFAQWPPLDGATVLWVRARRGGREDRLAYLVDVVSVLTSRPGSIGIMQESAATLVALVPSLINLFPGAAWQQTQADDLTHMGEAVRDLLVTLAEEHPLVLLLDDLHAADPASLRVLDAATSSLDGVRLAVVAASRPRMSLFASPWPTIELAPLEQEQVAAIVADLEQVRLDPSVMPLLAAATGGIPLHAVQALRVLADRGLIARDDGTWRRVAGEPGVAIPTPRDLVANMILMRSAAARRVLAALSLADGPVTVEELERLTRTPTGVREHLDELDEAGLVQRLGQDRWQVGHDVVADTVLHEVPLDQRRELSLELATRLAAEASSVSDVRRVVRHYLEADAPEAMLEAVRAWHARTPEAPRGEALADVLLGPSASPLMRRRLIRAIPTRGQLGWRMALAVLATMGAMTMALLVWLRQPARLELVNSPTYAFFLGIPPLFEVRDHLGRVVTSLDGQRARVSLVHGADSIIGRLSEPIRDGVVSLDSLRVYESEANSNAEQPLVLDVEIPGLRSSRFTLRQQLRDSLWFEAGVLAGQSLAPPRPVIRVRPGDPIEGWVRLRYNSRAAAVLHMMTQMATWMPARADTTSISSLITPAQRAFLQVRTVRYVAPRTPGTYWLAWSFAAEPAAVWISSSTSWRCGAPVWDDGNEKQLLGDSAFRRIWGAGGQVTFRKLTCEPGQLRRMMLNPIVMTSVQVVVE